MTVITKIKSNSNSRTLTTIAAIAPASTYEYLSQRQSNYENKTDSRTNTYSFYRAMLCIARTMLSKDVCSSVCPPVCLSFSQRRYSVETAKHIIELFWPSDSHVILVFSHIKCYGNILTWTADLPPNGSVECRTTSPSSRKLYKTPP